MTVTNTPKVRLAAAVAAVFAVKLAALVQLGDHPLLQPGGGLDSDYYYRLAERVRAGDLLLGPGLFFVSPLYIYFLAAVLAASGGSLFFVKVVQIALGTAACALVWLTARAWFSNRAAWIALTLAALTGVFTFYEVLILQAALDPFLTALALWVLTMALQRGGVRWPALAGLAFAVHALNRPNIFLVASGLVLLLVGSGLRPSSAATDRGRIRQAAAFVLGIAIALAPVTVRNFVVTGSLTPMPSHGGLNLYIGNNPRADGTYRGVDGITPNIAGQAEDARRVAQEEAGRPLTDAGVSAHFTRKALRWMREEPRAAGRLFLRKVAYTLNAGFLTLNYSYPFYREESPVLRVLFVGPLLLAPLGMVGLFACWFAGDPPPRDYWLWAATVPLLVVSVAVFFVASRYRLPLLVPLCLTAGGLLSASWTALERRRVGALVTAAVCAWPLVVVASWDFGLDDGRLEEETRMTVWLVSNGRAADAEARLARVGDSHVLAGVAHLRVGQAYERAGDLGAAVRHYTRATEIDPDEPAPRQTLARASGRLGVALARQNRDEEALQWLGRAARLAPSDATAHLNLAVQLGRMGRSEEARAAAERAVQIDPTYERAREFLRVLRGGR